MLTQVLIVIAVIAVLFAVFKPRPVAGSRGGDGPNTNQLRVVWLVTALVAVLAYLLLA